MPEELPRVRRPQGAHADGPRNQLRISVPDAGFAPRPRPAAHPRRRLRLPAVQPGVRAARTPRETRTHALAQRTSREYTFSFFP